MLSSLDLSKKSIKHLYDKDVTPENVKCHPYIKSNGIESYYYQYTPNKEVFKKLLKEITQVQSMYTAVINDNEWDEISETKKPEYWQKIFLVQG